GPLPSLEAIEIAVQILRAVAHAHAAGILHRDLNPRNVFLTREGHVKVLDFGLAHLVTALQQDGRSPEPTGGTPPYIAPERYRGGPEDPRGDGYSVGRVLWEMLAGALPAAGAAASLPEAIPDALAEVVRRAVREDPTERYGSAAEMLEALRSV